MSFRFWLGRTSRLFFGVFIIKSCRPNIQPIRRDSYLTQRTRFIYIIKNFRTPSSFPLGYEDPPHVSSLFFSVPPSSTYRNFKTPDFFLRPIFHGIPCNEVKFLSPQITTNKVGIDSFLTDSSR